MMRNNRLRLGPLSPVEIDVIAFMKDISRKDAKPQRFAKKKSCFEKLDKHILCSFSSLRTLRLSAFARGGFLIWFVAALFLATSIGIAADSKPSVKSAAARKLAVKIDEHIAAKLKAENVEPAPRADDAEFYRRLSLHLSGSIPPAADVRKFLADESAHKRDAAVESFLSRAAYVRNFSTVWRRAWLPDADVDPQIQVYGANLETWLRGQMAEDRKYDDIVRDLLSVPVAKSAAAASTTMNGEVAGPLAFLLAREGKPENLAAGVSRAFLGVRLDCAQCHDHPFDRWKREQFWSFAAFFAGLDRGGNNQPALTGGLFEVSDRRELMIPDTDKLAAAVFLDGSEPKWRTQSGRELLAKWITSRENPYFAKAAVNRLWGHLFGIGLVDPVDDFSSANEPSHPELLDELAAAFVDRNYDVKYILRAMLLSEAYQRTSRQITGDVPASLYASFAVQGLSAEELVRSLAGILGTEGSPENLAVRFARTSESPTQRQTTILQALTLMNGGATAQATNADQGALLAAIADFPGQTPAEQIETLFLATLSRLPSEAESQRCVKHIESAMDSRRALGDVLWSLLNSAEFGCNH